MQTCRRILQENAASRETFLSLWFLQTQLSEHNGVPLMQLIASVAGLFSSYKQKARGVMQLERKPFQSTRAWRPPGLTCSQSLPGEMEPAGLTALHAGQPADPPADPQGWSDQRRGVTSVWMQSCTALRSRERGTVFSRTSSIHTHANAS